MAQSRSPGRVAIRSAIKAFGLAGAVSTAVAMPGTAIIWRDLESFNRLLKKHRKNSRSTLSHLKYRKIVEVKQVGGHYEYRLTKKGLDRYQKIILEDLAISTPRRWDYKWRLVMFDIPRGRNSSRASLLNMLRQLGFYRLQDSAWIHPFECEKEMGVVLDYLNLQKYVSYMVVDKGNFTEHATRHFKRAGLLM